MCLKMENGSDLFGDVEEFVDAPGNLEIGFVFEIISKLLEGFGEVEKVLHSLASFRGRYIGRFQTQSGFPFPRHNNRSELFENSFWN